MGMFDAFKDKAAELVQGAKDQVSELTGSEPTIDGVADRATDQANQVTQTADDISQEGQNVIDNAGTAADDAAKKFPGE